MFFKFEGRGMLVPVYVVVSVVAVALVSGLLQYVGLYLKYDFPIVIGIGIILSGIWIHATSDDYITVNGKKEKIYLNNHLYFLPLKTWSYILLYTGSLIFISGILSTLEKLKLL
ncbi:hypothetical protein [Flavobacterium sp.]|uniref:hypothetical protein n=1 Tax=Flavobacterium sp. TaxID=239 RepID=UPI003D6B499A